ncbi:MAG: methyl-accepting chemotaxis protein [Burkholderiales bacterium]
MGNLKIRTRLLLASGMAMIAAMVLAGFTLYSGQRNTRALEAVYAGSVHQAMQQQKIDAQLRELRFRAAGVLLELMPVPGSLNHLREARDDIVKAWKNVETADGSADTAEQAAERASMKKGWEHIPALLTKLEQAYVANNNKQITTVLEDDWPLAHKAFIKPLQTLIPLTEAAARATFEAARTDNRMLSGLSITLALACMAVIATVMLLTMRSIGQSLRQAVAAAHSITAGDLSQTIECQRRDELGELLDALAQMQQSLHRVVAEVRRGIDSMATATGEIAAGNQDLSSRTELQAGSLQRAASSMDQMTGTVKTNADNARQASELAASASEVATRGGEVVGQVVSTMTDIQHSSHKIVDIIGVIDGIAFQTNILALNAAVEAARAGEQGRGFAVVASEVRSLAQRSAAAAREITALIGASVDKVESGSRLVRSAGSTMDDIVAQVRHVTTLVSQISVASGEQTTGIMQVNQAVTQLDEVTQRNAALVEQGAAAAESLKAQAARLAEAVSVFRLRDHRANS